MTKQAMLRQLRLHLNDEQKIGWEFDEELIEFLDRSASFITNLLIKMRHNSLIRPLLVEGDTELPSDFVTFVGKLPIQIMGNIARPYGKVDRELVHTYWRDPNLPNYLYTPSWKDPSDEDQEYTTWDDLIKEKKFNTLYWSRLPFVSDFEDTEEVPYKKEFAMQVIDIARMLALNKNEYTLQQDLDLFGQIQAALGSVIGQDDQ
jgi:hypothetical protein